MKRRFNTTLQLFTSNDQIPDYFLSSHIFHWYSYIFVLYLNILDAVQTVKPHERKKIWSKYDIWTFIWNNNRITFSLIYIEKWKCIFHQIILSSGPENKKKQKRHFLFSQWIICWVIQTKYSMLSIC